MARAARDPLTDESTSDIASLLLLQPSGYGAPPSANAPLYARASARRHSFAREQPRIFFSISSSSSSPSPAPLERSMAWLAARRRLLWNLLLPYSSSSTILANSTATLHRLFCWYRAREPRVWQPGMPLATWPPNTFCLPLYNGDFVLPKRRDFS